MQEILPSYERFYRASRARIFKAALAGRITHQELMTRLGRIQRLRDDRHEEARQKSARVTYRGLTPHGKILLRLNARATRPRHVIA